MQHSWDDIQKEYETTDASIPELAEKYGIKLPTIKSRKQRQGWSKDASASTKDASKREKMHPARRESEPPPESDPELTDKQQVFVMEYLKDFNATRAALAASYSKKTAYSIGWELLRKPAVQAAIQRHRDTAAAELGLSVQRVIMEYMKIAFADVSDYLDFGQREVQVMGPFGPVFEGKGKNKKPVMKTVNYVDLKPASELDVSLIAEVKQGRDGVGIKLHSKMEALEALTKYLDVLPDHHKRMIEEKKLELQAEQVAIAKNKANGDDPPGAQDDGFFDALKGKAKEVWADETEAGGVPMETDVDEADQGADLVDGGEPTS